MKMPKILTSRKFRQGSVASAVTLIVIALVVVLNMVVSLLADRYNLSLDLTSSKAFGLSEDSLKFLEGLQKDVTIYILNTESSFTGNGEYFNQANEVAKEYTRHSSHIGVEYVDVNRNPGFVSRWPDLQLGANSIVVSCGNKARDLTAYDLFNIETNYQTYTQSITSSKAEQAMTSAIINVTSDKLVGVSILSGHNEYELAGLSSLLELNGYAVYDQNLLTDEISPEATIAVLAAPARDLTEEELKKLDDFLNNGGKLGKTLLYLADSTQPQLGNISAFLADWGITVGDGIVYESDQSHQVNMSIVMTIADYTEDVYSKTVKERNLFTVIPYSRPLGTLFEAKSGISVTVPLQFSAAAGIIPADAGSDWQPSPSEIAGPLPALIVANHLTYEGTTPLNSYVVACGSAIALDDQLLSAKSLGNSDYFLSLFASLSNREDTVSIKSKALGGSELGINAAQVIVLFAILVILFPLALLVTGIVIWLRRLHK